MIAYTCDRCGEPCAGPTTRLIAELAPTDWLTRHDEPVPVKVESTIRIDDDDPPDLCVACEGALLLAALPEPFRVPLPNTVYVLFHETNTGTGDESDGYVENVYRTQAAADAACLALRRKAWADGRGFVDPDHPDDGGENEQWQEDYHVDAHEVAA